MTSKKHQIIETLTLSLNTWIKIPPDKINYWCEISKEIKTEEKIVFFFENLKIYQDNWIDCPMAIDLETYV